MPRKAIATVIPWNGSSRLFAQESDTEHGQLIAWAIPESDLLRFQLRPGNEVEIQIETEKDQYCRVLTNISLDPLAFDWSAYDEVPMKAGDIVKYSKPVDAAESECRFILLRGPEHGRVDIQLICDARIKPIETVETREVARVEERQGPSEG